MSNEIGAVLEIPDSVFQKIDKAEKAIKQLETTAVNSADKINKSFLSIGNQGLSKFIEMVQKAQSEVGKIDLSKLTTAFSGIGNADEKTASVAKNITAAAVAMNQFSKYSQSANASLSAPADKERKAYIDRLEMYKRMFDQIKRNEERTIAAEERKAAATERASKRQLEAMRKIYEEQAKLYKQQNLKSNTTYEGSIQFAQEAKTINRRVQAIKYLTAARNNLSTADAKYDEKLKALNTTIREMNRLNDKAVEGSKRLSQQHSNLLNTSDQLMRKLALVFSVSQISGYMKRLVNVRAEFELQNVALASILQNKDKANQLFDQITQLAIRSPFTIKELVTYTKSLSAYQVEYEKLYDTTKMLADVSAGLGVDMQRLILAFGQVKAAGFLRGTETRQFTEAGFNILGELAKYYSELEGRIISVGEVQERQFKRMIAWTDVEEVFKRVTSAGGMFYEMQERQANTLRGQISNLQDSIDLMLNSIGQANEGMIKGLFTVLKGLVDNWEILANAMSASVIAFGFYIGKLLLATINQKAFTTATNESTVAQGGLQKVITKSVAAFRKFLAVLKANPWLLVIAGTVLAAKTISDHVKKVDEAREKYDVLTRTLNSSKQEIDGLAAKLQTANEAIKTNQSIMDNLSEGTDEYKTAQETLNEAQKEQSTILNELKVKYPEIYAGIVKQKDGTIDLTEAQAQFNAELEKTKTLNFLMQADEGWFNEGIMTDLQQLSSANKDYQSQLENISTAYEAIKAKASAMAKTGGAVSRTIASDIQRIIDSSKTAAEKVGEIYSMLSKTDVSVGESDKIKEIAEKAGLGYATAMNKFNRASKEANAEIGKLIDNFLQAEGFADADAFKGLSESAQKEALKSAQAFINTIPAIKDEFVQSFVNEQFNIKLGVTFDFKKDIEPQLSEVQKGINAFIEKNQLDTKLIPKIEASNTLADYFGKLKDKLKDLEKESEKLAVATERISDEGTNEEVLASNEKQIKQLKLILAAYGELDKKKTTEKKDNTALNELKERINLIKKAGDEYEKYLKYYDKEEAALKVRNNLADAAAALDMTPLLLDMDFDLSGIITALENLWNNAGKDGEKAIKEALYPLKTEQDIKFKEQGLDAIQKKLDNLFQNYEFSLELNTAGVSKESFAQMLKSLGADEVTIDKVMMSSVSLDDLRKQIKDIIASLQEQGGKANLDKAEEYQKKLTELELKEAQKRLDEIAKLRERFATKEELINKKSMELDKLREERDEYKGDTKEEEKANEQILEYYNLRIKAGEEELLQLKSEALQLTDFWTQLFGDLSDLGISSLRELVRMSDEVLANVKPVEIGGQVKGYTSSYEDKNGIKREVTLTVNQYQRLLKQSRQVADEIQKKNPFIALYDAIKAGKLEGESTLDYIVRLQGYMNSAISTSKELASNLATIFGADDEAQETLSNIMNIVQGASDLGMGIARIATGDYIGGAISAVKGIASIVGSITDIYDRKREAEIERQLEAVERLEKSYEDLKEAVDNAYDYNSLKKGTDEIVRNLEQQNKALQAAMAAEEDKKRTDEDRIKEWQEQYEDNLKAINEAKENLTEELGGFGSDANIKSAAEEFVTAWLDAFNETGDGLSGLQEQMNNFVQNAIQKQLLVKLSEATIKPLLESFDKMFASTSEGGEAMTAEEIAAWQKLYEEKSKEFDAKAQAYIEALKQAGVDVEAGTEMSGLQRGIQSVTEETANALEALLNSIRFFVADNNAMMRSFYQAFFSADVSVNPILQQLVLQTEQLRAMNTLWNSLTKVTGNNGKALKVLMV